MIALAGIVVRNSLILVEFIARARARGMQLKQALIQAGAVLLTAGAILLGDLVITLDPVFSGLALEIPALDRSMTAQLEELAPAAEPGARSFLVKARVPYDKDLLPGMYARLLVPAGSKEQLVVPIDRVF